MKPKPKTLESINLWQISDVALKNNLKEISLQDYKVLSTGKLALPVVIKAGAFSKKAAEKIQAAGGKTEIIKKQKQAIEKKA